MISIVRWSVIVSSLMMIGVGTAKIDAVAQRGVAAPAAGDADELYRHRDIVANAKRAADLWALQAKSSFEAAWKLARASYYLGKALPEGERRAALERGIAAGDTAVALAPGRPEGHFWLGANMGGMAESFGVYQELKYRGRIKLEFERVISIEPDWQEDSAECGLGQWYFQVPTLLGGSRVKAEELLRHALTAHPQSKTALTFLADGLIGEGRNAEARALLQRVLESPIDPEWVPEDTDLQRQAAARLKTLK